VSRQLELQAIVTRAILDALYAPGGARSKIIAEQLRRDHPDVAWPDDLAAQIERALRASCIGDPAELMVKLARSRTP
jgi:hypothetical protein